MVRRYGARLTWVAGMILASSVCSGLAESDRGRRHAQLTAENRLAFTRRIQPILFNCCGSSACHGRSDAPGLALKVPAQYGQLTPNMTEHNLEQVLSLVNLDKPQESPLLRLATQAHGTSVRPPLPGKLAPAYRVLENWVQALAGQPPLQTSPGEVSTTVPTRPASSPSPHYAMPPETATTHALPNSAQNPPLAPPMAAVGESAMGSPPAISPSMLPLGGQKPSALGKVSTGPNALAPRADKPNRNIGFAGSVLPGTIVGSSTEVHVRPTQSQASSPPSWPNTSGAIMNTLPAPSTVAPPVPAYVPIGIKPPSVADGLKPQVPPPAGAALPSVISANPHSAAPNSTHLTTPGAPSGAAVLPRSTFLSTTSTPTKPVTPAPAEPVDPFDPSVFNRALHPDFPQSKP